MHKQTYGLSLSLHTHHHRLGVQLRSARWSQQKALLYLSNDCCYMNYVRRVAILHHATT